MEAKLGSIVPSQKSKPLRKAKVVMPFDDIIKVVFSVKTP